MTFELSKNFHGVGIGPLSKILAVKYLSKLAEITFDLDFLICGKILPLGSIWTAKCFDDLGVELREPRIPKSKCFFSMIIFFTNCFIKSVLTCFLNF